MNYFAIEYGWDDNFGDHVEMLSRAKVEKDGYVDISFAFRESNTLLFENEEECDRVVAAIRKMRPQDAINKVQATVNPYWQGKLNLYKA